ncbi:MAG: hypothetical protein HYX94_07625 [Chloroflexi bacterium]|nr:hypothetical protein [Chloroflexota bacterium]
MSSRRMKLDRWLCLVALAAFLALPPAPAAAFGGSLPRGLPDHFFLGLANHPDELKWMVGSGVPWDARYYYLSGGVNTGQSWTDWLPDGGFASIYMADSARNGYLPVFSYYQIQKSAPGLGNSEVEIAFSNLNNLDTMAAYYAEFKLLMEKARAFGKPVLVHVEPDLWGFMQQRIGGGENPAKIPVSVASSGFKDVKGFANDLSGFGKALLHLRDRYARNVILAVHASPWATNLDVSTSKDVNLDVEAIGRKTGKFLASTGKWDLVFVDLADRDAGYLELVQKDGGSHWWDKSNQTYPNFSRFARYLDALSSQMRLRLVLWQVPVGNTIMRTSNNTEGHYQDNRVEYFLDRSIGAVEEYARAGVIGVLFGRGAPGPSTYTDDKKDGVTNPLPINGNLEMATLPDDDGGFLRLRAGDYYGQGAFALPSPPRQIGAIRLIRLIGLIALALLAGCGLAVWRKRTNSTGRPGPSVER